MHKSGRFRAATVGFASALVLVLAACGSDSDESADTTTTTAADRQPGVVTIGVIAPLEDGLTAFGLGMRNAVQLAVDEANANEAIPGFTIEVEALDDSSDPDTGREAAETIAADPTVIGVVGTYNSGVAAEVAPVLEEAGIAMISPANTDPALTIGDDRDNPERQHANYFRLVATDAQQGPMLAAYGRDGLEATTAAVVSETKDVSSGLADDFAAGFTAEGGTIAYRETVPDATTDFGEVVEAIGALDTPPDLIFFGGEYSVAADFRAEATEAGIEAPLMGGDGIKDDAFIAEAGPASDGTIASTVGVPLDEFVTAADFAAAYDAADFDEPASDFGAYAYDAANLLIAAAGVALDGAEAVDSDGRAAVIAELDVTETDGVTGTIAFDEYGDTTTKVFTIYRVQDGAWVPIPEYVGFQL